MKYDFYITGTIGWDTGSVSLGLAYFGKSGMEYMFEVEQELNEDFSIRAGMEYSWDEEWDEKVWRPHVALNYSHNGWDAVLRWTKNEYISDQKDSKSNFKGRLDRRPEFTVWIPWFRQFSSWNRIFASYGSYDESTLGQPEGFSTSRYGMGFRSYFERALNKDETVEFFTDSEGALWMYDRENADQEMLRSFAGLRYTIGAFQLGTGYEKQYSWGESPMHWDQYKDRQRIHQKIRFPLGREVYTVLRGSYDLKESMIDEMHYSLQWVTDCMIWELHYKNDRTSGGNDHIGLSIAVRAFPESPASFGQSREIDPFVRPRDVPKDGKKKVSWY